MALLSDLWKKGTTPPLASDIVEGGLAVDVLNQKVYSKDSSGNIFQIGKEGDVEEAPSDGNIYGRRNEGWENVTVLYSDLSNLIQTHIDNREDPHDVTKLQVGLGAVENIAPADMPISDDTQDALNLKANTDDVFAITDFIDTSTGTADAASPIILNGAGQIDPSMIDASTFYFVGDHDPSAGTEYPDLTGETHGAFWVINPISNPDNPPCGGDDPEPKCEYAFTSGDLNGKVVNIGDFMVWGSGGWAIMAGEMNPTLYYRLDGTQPLTADFAAGTHRLTNVGPAVADTDALTKGQVAPLLDAYVEVAGDRMIGDLEIKGGTPAFVLIGNDDVRSRLTDTGAALGIQTNRNDIVFAGVANAPMQGSLYVRRTSGITYKIMEETDIEIGAY